MGGIALKNEKFSSHLYDMGNENGSIIPFFLNPGPMKDSATAIYKGENRERRGKFYRREKSQKGDL